MYDYQQKKERLTSRGGLWVGSPWGSSGHSFLQWDGGAGLISCAFNFFSYTQKYG